MTSIARKLTYLAGMLSGWTVVGMLRRSFKRVTEEPVPGEPPPPAR